MDVSDYKGWFLGCCVDVSDYKVDGFWVAVWMYLTIRWMVSGLLCGCIGL